MRKGLKLLLDQFLKKNTVKLNQLNNDLIFLAFTNKIDQSNKNIISGS